MYINVSGRDAYHTDIRAIQFCLIPLLYTVVHLFVSLMVLTIYMAVWQMWTLFAISISDSEYGRGITNYDEAPQ